MTAPGRLEALRAECIRIAAALVRIPESRTTAVETVNRYEVVTLALRLRDAADKAKL